MCGIAGIYAWHGDVDKDLITGMTSCLAHRGPDDHGVHVDRPVGFGHTRLSIIDVAHGHQPLFSRDNRIALVANGEIYNHVELREKLEDLGHVFTTHSDSESIIYAYLEYGLEFLHVLQGMFAFALYDRQERRLILARDRLGIKPLFFFHDSKRLVFASEIKALLPVFNTVPEINPTAFVQFLQIQFSTGRQTIFNGIERLLPGEVMCIGPDQDVRQWRYWSAAAVKPADITYDEAASRFDDLMATVMRQHMRTDVPFGLFLSGGVDSSILLALLSRYSDEPIRTFSVSFSDAPRNDELTTATALAKHFKSRHSLIQPHSDDMLTRMVRSIWAADDLMRDFATMPTLMLAEEAGHELKVVFSGEGGDEIFAGYGRYRVPALGRWLKSLIAPGSGGFRTRGNFSHRQVQALFSPRLQQAEQAWRHPTMEAWQAAPSSWSRLSRMQYIDLANALPDNLLVKLDRMLMAQSIEGRVPFLDHRVVEFGLALPDRLKVQGRQGKVFLKRWASNFIPADFWVRKSGFHVPMGHWLQGDYLDRLGSVLVRNQAICNWFRPEGVMQLIDQQSKHRNVTRNIAALLQFAIWHRLFVEGDGAMPALQDPVDFIS